MNPNPKTIYHGDNRVVLKELIRQGVQVDSVVTDPPYGISFMGKKWDYDVPTTEFWELVWQILKPGGHVLSFGGTRTYHRLVCNLEDAGFEIRDMISWMYGSGFPKSMDISKAIDKHGGARPDKIELANHIRERRIAKKISAATMASWFSYAEVTKNWERLDQGHRVPKPEDYEVLIERLGCDVEFRFFIKEAAEREIVGHSTKGQGQGWVGDGVAGFKSEFEITKAATPEAKQWAGWGTALKPAIEPIVLARKPLSEPTVAANVLKHGTGGLNIDGCRVEYEEGGNLASNPSLRTHINGGNGGNIFPTEENRRVVTPNPTGRFPANVILDEEAGAMLDEQTGILSSGGQNRSKGLRKNKSGEVFELGHQKESFVSRHDTGGASRFFYCAKASKKERRGSKHPTVKPLALMRYLCRLITRPGGLVLDPFAGSGTTGEAALLEGFTPLLIELEAEYVPDIEKRLAAPLDADKRVSEAHLDIFEE